MNNNDITRLVFGEYNPILNAILFKLVLNDTIKYDAVHEVCSDEDAFLTGANFARKYDARTNYHMIFTEEYIYYLFGDFVDKVLEVNKDYIYILKLYEILKENINITFESDRSSDAMSVINMHYDIGRQAYLLFDVNTIKCTSEEDGDLINSIVLKSDEDVRNIGMIIEAYLLLPK